MTLISQNAHLPSEEDVMVRQGTLLRLSNDGEEDRLSGDDTFSTQSIDAVGAWAAGALHEAGDTSDMTARLGMRSEGANATEALARRQITRPL